MCGFFIDGFQNELVSFKAKQNFSLMFLCTTVVELIPFLMFFLLDRPHDCFVCLGKDPDRIYSIFQLKTEERIERKMFPKNSMREDVNSTLVGTWHQKVIGRPPSSKLPNNGLELNLSESIYEPVSHSQDLLRASRPNSLRVTHN